MTTSLRPRRVRLAVATTVVAITATFGLSACGSSVAKPSQDALAAKLKTESTLSTLTDSQLSCFAGVLEKYARASDLAKYVAGSESLDDIKGDKSNEDKVTSESKACATA